MTNNVSMVPIALTSSLTETPCNSAGKPGMWSWIRALCGSSDLATTSRPTGGDVRRGDLYGEASRRRLALLALPRGSGVDDLDLDHPAGSPAHINNKKYVLWNTGISPIASKVGHVTLATPPLGSFIVPYVVLPMAYPTKKKRRV